MKKVGLLLGILVLTVGMSSCTIAKISTKGAKPVLMNQPTGAFDVVQHVKLDKGISFDFTNSFELDDVVARSLQETGADALINVRVEIKMTVGDYLLNMVTCNIANAKTALIEGDAVKFK